jgi:DNA polymerase I
MNEQEFDPAAAAAGPEPKKILLVDTSAFAHASWHGSQPYMDSRGLCCRVARGVVRRLHGVREHFEWDLIVNVMDAEGGSLYRKGLYADYKANRPENDPDFTRQKRELAGWLRALGLNPVAKAGFEADDLLGTIAQREAEAGNFVGIVSPDKDLSQMVSERIFLLRPVKDDIGRNIFETYAPQDVFERFGVWPEQVADWLALQGDSSDNIPGVDKVGPKTATRWLQAHQSLEQIMAAADNEKAFPGVSGKNLRDAVAMLPTIKLLTTILRDVPIERHEWSSGKSSFAEADRAARALMLPDEHADWAHEGDGWGIQNVAAADLVSAPRSRSGWGAPRA